jgi:hypothetical protein
MRDPAVSHPRLTAGEASPKSVQPCRRKLQFPRHLGRIQGVRSEIPLVPAEPSSPSSDFTGPSPAVPLPAP